VHGAKAQVARGEDGPTDGTWGEKSVIMRIGQKPNIGQWSPSKGQGQGVHSSGVRPIRVQRKKIYPSPQLNQNSTRSARTARATQNKNKEVYKVGKAWPCPLPT
jgi:hypothetical protein